MKAIIIEDEQRAAAHLERMLQKVAPDITVVAKLETVRDATEYLTSTMPDLIFTDVQLADGVCFGIFKEVQVSCPVIFTTAFDYYAIEAFDANGIDYLLKPVEEQRLEKAIRKARLLSPAAAIEKIMSITQTQPSRQFKSRFLVRIADKIKTIASEDILAFYSLEKATYLHTTGNRNYHIDYPLDHLEKILDPDKFFRINRKYIIAASSCNNITVWSNSRLKLKIDGLDDNDIIVARERVQEFREWLDR